MRKNRKCLVLGIALFLGAWGNGLRVNASDYYTRYMEVEGPLFMTKTYAMNYTDTFDFKESTGYGTRSWNQNYYDYTITATTSEIASDAEGVVLGSTAYAELRNGVTGTFVSADQSTATNLKKLDTALSKMGNESVASGSTAAITVTSNTETGADGIAKTTYTVKANTGDISDGLGTLVTGGTLYNQVHLAENGNYIQANKKTGENLKLLDDQIETNRVQIFETNKNAINGLKSMTNISEDAKTLLKNLTKDGVQVAAGNESITVTSADDAEGNRTYTVSAQTAKEISQGSTKLVTGDTIYKEIHLATDGNYIQQSKTLAENLTILDQQVKINSDTIIALDQRVGNQIETLTGDLNQVGASAAALAALRPEPFDADDKWSFAVGYGHYRNRNAAAVGIYFKPTADTTISFGSTVWSGDSMLNVNTSFKLGSRGKVAKAPTNPETQALTQRVKALEAIETKQVGALDGQSKQIGKMEAESAEQRERLAHLEKDRNALQESQQAQVTIHAEKAKTIARMQAEGQTFRTETAMLQAEKAKMEKQMAAMLAGLGTKKGGAQ